MFSRQTGVSLPENEWTNFHFSLATVKVYKKDDINYDPETGNHLKADNMRAAEARGFILRTE